MKNILLRLVAISFISSLVLNAAPDPVPVCRQSTCRLLQTVPTTQTIPVEDRAIRRDETALWMITAVFIGGTATRYLLKMRTIDPYAFFANIKRRITTIFT